MLPCNLRTSVRSCNCLLVLLALAVVDLSGTAWPLSLKAYANSEVRRYFLEGVAGFLAANELNEDDAIALLRDEGRIILAVNTEKAKEVRCRVKFLAISV